MWVGVGGGVRIENGGGGGVESGRERGKVAASCALVGALGSPEAC